MQISQILKNISSKTIFLLNKHEKTKEVFNYICVFLKKDISYENFEVKNNILYIKNISQTEKLYLKNKKNIILDKIKDMGVSIVDINFF